MGWLDSVTISAALAANPQLRRNLHELIGRLSDNSFTRDEVTALERELVGVLRLAEVRKLPSSMPAAGHPLVLERSQVTTVFDIVGRFRDPQLRKRAETVIAQAIGTGKVLST